MPKIAAVLASPSQRGSPDPRETDTDYPEGRRGSGWSTPDPLGAYFKSIQDLQLNGVRITHDYYVETRRITLEWYRAFFQFPCAYSPSHGRFGVEESMLSMVQAVFPLVRSGEVSESDYRALLQENAAILEQNFNTVTSESWYTHFSRIDAEISRWSNILKAIELTFGSRSPVSAEERLELERSDSRFGQLLRQWEDMVLMPTDYFRHCLEALKSLHDSVERRIDTIVLHNLLLVVEPAMTAYRGQLEELDLLQEGNFGLRRAVYDYCPEKGKFSTYARFWIKQKIRRAVADKGSMVRIPVHAQEKARKAFHGGGAANGRSLPTVTGLISEFEDGESSESDSLCWEGLKPPQKLMQHETLRHLEVALSSLDPRERSVLELRYGLNGNEEMSLEQVGDTLQLSRERIRQIERECLKKLYLVLKSFDAKAYDVLESLTALLGT